MRFALLSTVLLAAAACDKQPTARPAVENRLYYPTGLAFVPPADAGVGLGRLYVANSNFDRRFDVGWLTTIDLAQVRTPDGRGLPATLDPVAPPPDGGSDQGRPVQFTNLATTGANLVIIADFAGLATVDLQRSRLFVPSRAEGDYLHVLDIGPNPDGGVPLRCFFAGGTDCTVDGIDLAVEQTPGSFGLPAAPQPYSVTVADDTDEIYVTHLRPASSPAQSITNLQNYLVTLTQSELEAAQAAFPSAGRYVPPDGAFSPIGRGATNSIVISKPDPSFLYVSGRVQLTSSDPDVLLRVVDRTSKLYALPQIQLVWSSLEARGLQLKPDGTRLYLAVDNPATLLVLDIEVPEGNEIVPGFSLVRAVPLPEGPNDVQLLQRAGGRGPLVVISCSVDGSLAFYDDELGQVAALVSGVGAVPFAIAVDQRALGMARLYVSNFGDGRIAVVDVPLTPGVSLAPRIVGHLGTKQFCLLATDDRNCVDTSL
jgi:hypothetical protein